MIHQWRRRHPRQWWRVLWSDCCRGLSFPNSLLRGSLITWPSPAYAVMHRARLCVASASVCGRCRGSEGLLLSRAASRPITGPIRDCSPVHWFRTSTDSPSCGIRHILRRRAPVGDGRPAAHPHRALLCIARTLLRLQALQLCHSVVRLACCAKAVLCSRAWLLAGSLGLWRSVPRSGG